MQLICPHKWDLQLGDIVSSDTFSPLSQPGGIPGLPPDAVIEVTSPKGASNDTLLHEGQITALRAINGGLNWLSSRSRPDLAVQTSISQHPPVEISEM